MTNGYDDAGRIVSAPGGRTRAARRAKHKSKRAQMRGWEADLRVLGNPAITSKATATLEKCGKVLDGDWRISSVRHEISASGYICSIKLVRPEAGATASNTVAAAGGSTGASSDAAGASSPGDDSIEVNLAR